MFTTETRLRLTVIGVLLWTAWCVWPDLAARPYSPEEQLFRRAAEAAPFSLSPWRDSDGLAVAQPLHQLATHVARAALGRERSATRGVSTAAMLLSAFVLAWLVERRCGAPAAVLALIFYLTHPLYGRLALEGTPAALLVGLALCTAALALRAPANLAGAAGCGSAAGLASLVYLPIGYLLLLLRLLRPEPRPKRLALLGASLALCALVSSPKLAADWRIHAEGLVQPFPLRNVPLYPASWRDPFTAAVHNDSWLWTLVEGIHWHPLLVAGLPLALYLLFGLRRNADPYRREEAVWFAACAAPLALAPDPDGGLILLASLPLCVAVGRLIAGRPPTWLVVLIAAVASWNLCIALPMRGADWAPSVAVMAAVWVAATALVGVLAWRLARRTQWLRALAVVVVLPAALPAQMPALRGVTPVGLGLAAAYLKTLPEPTAAYAYRHPAAWLRRLGGTPGTRLDRPVELARAMDSGDGTLREPALLVPASRMRDLERGAETRFSWLRVGLDWHVPLLFAEEYARDPGLFRAVQMAPGFSDSEPWLVLRWHGRVEAGREVLRKRPQLVFTLPTAWWMVPAAKRTAWFVDLERVGETVYVLDEDGRIARRGPGPELAGLDPPRPCVDLEIVLNGRGHYLLERSGKVHAFGEAVDFGVPGRVNRMPWRVKARPDGRGYVVFHRMRGLAVAGEIAVDGEALDFGWEADIGRDLELCPRTGAPVLLDSAGGLHVLGPAPGYVTPYWDPDARDAVDLELLADGTVAVLERGGRIFRGAAPDAAPAGTSGLTQR